MAELELVGIHPDGEHLVLTDDEGQRHRLVVDDALRAAVRRDRTGLEQLRTAGLRPRDIQALIRAGASAEDVAADSGLAIEHVRRYEGPALAERLYVAERARGMSLGREAGSPTLGDLVIDRLAARGVSDVLWDARRRGHEPWEVVARFVAGERDREATWQVDLGVGSLVATDDESRWLSETDLGDRGRRHLSAVRGARLYDHETDADLAPALAAVDAVIRDTRPPVPPERRRADPDRGDTDILEVPVELETDDVDSAGEDTEALLEELSAARGIRQRVEVDDDELAAQVRGADAIGAGGADDAEARTGEHRASVSTIRAVPDLQAPSHEGSGPEGAHTPSLWEDEPGAAASDQPPEPGSEAAASDRDEPPAVPDRRGRKRSRTSVPSWDEIVFGARSD